ncbi:hypothetical protein R69746_08486 [Paraburkholderia aspalathi]|uniref:hypothetical protein n=1 Tax=Paraburkholderia aspalathi TaxID=1324617 RepID=UPI00190CCBFC|nr:hypothetical protein [Paraburkholderia aspalathi]MBK3844381.1 hypothetical protein [Paraburkholderia aspalathi]CAE6871812.1 hypothetical protein R69746_08486 [Paraburkholderia aspalathi]
MNTCGDFSKAFKANMDALGLPVPTSLFSTQQQAISTVGQLVGAVRTFGTRVTILELIGAGAIADVLAAASAFYAAWYVGGLIGSLMVATDATLDCKNGVQATHFVRRWSGQVGLQLPPTLEQHIAMHPEIMQQRSNRKNYGFLARAPRKAA